MNIYYVYTYIPAVATIKEKEAMNQKQSKGQVYGSVQREDGEGVNDKIIILYKKEMGRDYQDTQG